MADKSEFRMNLVAIKRVDPYAKDIIDSSAHVAFYTFNPDETEWEKTDVEGAFFVYSRNAEPYHSVFINNRLNTNSLVEPITARFELQNQTPFLLYRNERGRIRGFWFYNRTECDRISELLECIVNEYEPIEDDGKNDDNVTTNNNSMGSSLPSEQPLDLITYSNSNIDIFSMLSKAQQDFNNSLTIPNVKSNNAAPQGLDVLTKSINNELSENSKFSLSSVAVPIMISSDNGTSQSVMNFFASAKPAKSKEVPCLKRMLSAPMHIDQIEKQHCAKTPLKEKFSSPPTKNASGKSQLLGHSMKTTYAKPLNIENGLSFMRIHSPNQQQQQQQQRQQTQSDDSSTSPLATLIASNSLSVNNVVDGGGSDCPSGRSTKKDILKKSSQAIGIKKITSRQQHFDPLQALLKKPVPVSVPVRPSISSNSLTTSATTPNKPALMPPTMFKSSADSSTSSIIGNKQAAKSTNNDFKANINSTPGDINGKLTTTNSTPKNCRNSREILPSQMMFLASTPKQQQKQSEKASIEHDDVQPLTQTQLLQAISYLMKNDSDFIQKIHEAYLKSFAEKVSQ